MNFRDTSKFHAGFAEPDHGSALLRRAIIRQQEAKAMAESIKTYAGSNHPVKDCFLTLELLIDDVDTADTDEPYDVDGAVTSLNIVIMTMESQENENERLREMLTDLVAVTKDDLLKLPEGYRARRAIDRAIAAVTSGTRVTTPDTQ